MGYPTTVTKTWVANEVLTAVDLNAEVVSIRANVGIPENIDDFSANVSEMQATTDPGEVGSESLSTTLEGELRRIRFVLAEITGNTYWYESPARNLQELSAQKVQCYLPFDGRSVDDALADTYSRGAFGSAATLDSADNIRRGAIQSTGFDSTNKVFGRYALGAPSAGEHHLLLPGHYRQSNEFRVALWFRNAPANSILALNAALGIKLRVNGSGNLVLTLDERTAASETSKTTHTITGATNVAGSSSFQHVLAEFKINDDGNDYMRLYLDGVVEGTAVTSATIHVTEMTYGMWQFCGNVDPTPATWDHFSAFSVMPDVEAVDPWTGTVNGAVSDGVFTSSGAVDMENATNINLATFVLELKARFRSSALLADTTATNYVRVRDDSMNRSFEVGFAANGLYLQEGAAGARQFAQMNTDGWHVYRIISNGGTDPVTSVWVDGIERLRLTNDTADATASDVIKLVAESLSGLEETQIEYIRWNDAVVTDPDVPLNITIDDVVLLDGSAISSGLLSNMQSSAAGDLFEINDRGPTLIGTSLSKNSDTTSTSATFEDLIGSSDLEYLLTLPADGRAPFAVQGQVEFVAGDTVGHGVGVTQDSTLTNVDLVGMNPATTVIADGAFVYKTTNLSSFSSSGSTGTISGAGDASSMTTLDLGTVAVGDIFILGAQSVPTGLTGGAQVDDLRISKSSGTAEIDFATSYTVSGNSGNITTTGLVNAVSESIQVSGVATVKKAGTLILNLGFVTTTLGGGTITLSYFIRALGSAVSSASTSPVRSAPRRLFESNRAVENSSNVLCSRAAVLVHSTSASTLTTRGESVLQLQLHGPGLLL